MKNQELYLNDTDIKALFMDADVDEILLTTDTEVFNSTEIDSQIIEDLHWVEVVDFGMKNIITDEFNLVGKVSYDEVSAVLVRYNDEDKYGNEVETFINKNITEVIKINY